jgi:hypothetical protein
MNDLSTTTHGRLLSVAIVIALVGGSIGSTQHDAAGVALMSASLILGLGLAFVAVGLALGSNPRFALLGVIALPGLFFLYVLALGVASRDHLTWPAYAFTALGLLFGLNALRGPTPRRRAHRPLHPAHAH